MLPLLLPLLTLDLASCPRFGACSRCLAGVELGFSFVESMEEPLLCSTTPTERELEAEKRASERGAHRRERERFLLRASCFLLLSPAASTQNPHQSSLFQFFLFQQAEPWSQSGDGRASKVRKRERIGSERASDKALQTENSAAPSNSTSFFFFFFFFNTPGWAKRPCSSPRPRAALWPLSISASSSPRPRSCTRAAPTSASAWWDFVGSSGAAEDKAAAPTAAAAALRLRLFPLLCLSSFSPSSHPLSLLLSPPQLSLSLSLRPTTQAPSPRAPSPAEPTAPRSPFRRRPPRAASELASPLLFTTTTTARRSLLPPPTTTRSSSPPSSTFTASTCSAPRTRSPRPPRQPGPRPSPPRR